MTDFSFDRLVICGVGLIGGSLARALRAAGAQGEIVGVGRSPASVERARELGVIDRALGYDDAGALAEALRDADLVVIAAPVAQTRTVLARIAPLLGAATVVTDAGSTKTDVVDAARAALGARFAQFVPAHPIAGREASGVDAALADLYVGRNVVLCPQAETAPAALARVAAMWRATGAQVHEMTAQRHDRIFAAVSHLPHLLAFAMLEQLLRAADVDAKFAFAGSGFRDFTRIAASNPEMWRDICIANRDALLAEIDAYATVLAELRGAVDARDGARLEAVLTRARAARAAWGERAAATPRRAAAPGVEPDTSCNDSN